jgi:Peptidase A4 family
MNNLQRESDLRRNLFMKHAIRSMVIAATSVALLAGFTMTAAGQISDSARMVYQTSATVKTNITGVSRFAEAPKGFNRLTASDEDLARFGFPPRPSDPAALAKWQKAMAHATKHWTGQLKAKPYGSRPMKPGPAPTEAAAAAAGKVSDVSFYGSGNWSGVASLSTLKSFSATKSIDLVISEFVVPSAQPPAGACGTSLQDNNGYFTSVWNGIDGFSNGDVLQGGTQSFVACGGGQTEVGWVEWYPSYSELDEFETTWGDDFYVETYDVSSTEGYVYIEDITTGVFDDVELLALEPPYLVGNSAEWIVERPCCGSNGLLPLADYNLDWMSFDWAENAHGTLYHAGNTAKTTAVISMYDDAFDQVISLPNPQKDTADTSKFNDTVLYEVDGCASYGGCTP